MRYRQNEMNTRMDEWRDRDQNRERWGNAGSSRDRDWEDRDENWRGREVANQDWGGRGHEGRDWEDSARNREGYGDRGNWDSQSFNGGRNFGGRSGSRNQNQMGGYGSSFDSSRGYGGYGSPYGHYGSMNQPYGGFASHREFGQFGQHNNMSHMNESGRFGPNSEYRQDYPYRQDSMQNRQVYGQSGQSTFGSMLSRSMNEQSNFGDANAYGGFNRQSMGRGPKGYKRSDERIKDDICERIVQFGLDASEVEIQVRDGEVTLQGSVRERIEKHRIEDVSESIVGVRDVNNQIRVKREYGEDRPTATGTGQQSQQGMMAQSGTENGNRRGATTGSSVHPGRS